MKNEFAIIVKNQLANSKYVVSLSETDIESSLIQYIKKDFVFEIPESLMKRIKENEGTLLSIIFKRIFSEYYQLSDINLRVDDKEDEKTLYLIANGVIVPYIFKIPSDLLRSEDISNEFLIIVDVVARIVIEYNKSLEVVKGETDNIIEKVCEERLQ